MTPDFEYGVDSRYRNKEERGGDSVALMEARLERMKNVSKEQIVRAKLVQLKLRMENYLKDPSYDNNKHFTNFLEMYIDAIYSQRNKFAEDINVTPVFLSQIINNHREPKQDFILKLMVHSEMAFQNVCDFHKKTWYQVYFQEKISDTMSSQAEWRPRIEKQVKVSELMEK
jgi:plasmid maintenance system antidote protein VapI